MMGKRPGKELRRRPLHFIWILDCSGSMKTKAKIASLNYAIKNALPAMRAEAEKNPFARVLVRAITFSSGAQWYIEEPTPLEEFVWNDVQADGVTDLGHALRMVAEQLMVPPMDMHALPPVLVLISDGQPTDDYESGLRELMRLPWGRKSIRLAIAIAGDADLDVLQQFIGDPNLKPLYANSSNELVKAIQWVSTTALTVASSPTTQATTSGRVDIPLPPPDDFDDGEPW
jgi:uncharacterized protein YegL